MNNKAVCFTYISKANRKFIEEQADSHGQTLSYTVDAIIEAARTKKPLKLEKSVPQYVAKAKAWQKKNPQLSA